MHLQIVVAGPAGCGKSECVKTFAVAEKERGKTLDVQTIFTKSMDSRELLGYHHPVTKEWKEGLLPALLRRFCLQQSKQNYDFNIKPIMKIMQLDGEVSGCMCDVLGIYMYCTCINSKTLKLGLHYVYFWKRVIERL